MRKLVVSTLVSLDGIIGAPDRWSGFDEESSQRSLQELNKYDAFVMGRVTYEYFRTNWGSTRGDALIDRVTEMPKYVASRTLAEATWNASLLGPDATAAIKRLKNQPGNDLIKWGVSRFDESLLREHLIDEFQLWWLPVVVGTGQRLFEDVTTSSIGFRLTNVETLTNGSVIHTYRPAYGCDANE